MHLNGFLFQVSQITNRMGEVDSNLNYLLGRLSLVTQEFNQIKDGLGTALDNIRNSFQIVQNKIEGMESNTGFSSNTHYSSYPNYDSYRSHDSYPITTEETSND